MKAITHDREYAVVLHDCRCLQGRIKEVNDKSLTLQREQSAITVMLTEIVSVAECCQATAHDFVFNDVSSWTYVKEALTRRPEFIRVVKSSRTEHRWSTPTVLEQSMSADGTTIKKTDVRPVFYVRVKPLSEGEAYAVREDAPLLAPHVWFNYAFSGRITVLLYDSTLSQASKGTCVVEPSRSGRQD